MQLQIIENKIYEVRGQKVLLDFDIAELYEVETKRINEAVRRNKERFPERFMFRLSQEEWEAMRSQIATAYNQKKRNVGITPFAFTEHGVTMLASVLRSKRAIQMNIVIVEAFIALKEFALNYRELSEKLKQIEEKYEQQFSNITEAINYLLHKDKIEVEQKQRKRIGFGVRND
ncbi:MAG: ORF6N domain-containing protein [Bacteroidales bacterium]|jgi:phage regulator Rha-like protein|nr:ORF6N domain-containing protein [Bacteroidales bacterium]